MSIYPGDRPLSRNITDRESRKLEIYDELVEALEVITSSFYGFMDDYDPEDKAIYLKAKAAIEKAKGEMK